MWRCYGTDAGQLSGGIKSVPIHNLAGSIRVYSSF